MTGQFKRMSLWVGLEDNSFSSSGIFFSYNFHQRNLFILPWPESFCYRFQKYTQIQDITLRNLSRLNPSYNILTLSKAPHQAALISLTTLWVAVACDHSLPSFSCKFLEGRGSLYSTPCPSLVQVTGLWWLLRLIKQRNEWMKWYYCCYYLTFFWQIPIIKWKNLNESCFNH